MSRIILRLFVLLLLIAGLAIRLFDLTDPPYDFHTTRQLHSAIIARGLYYERLPDADPERRELAAAYMKSASFYEPPILEGMSAYTYMLVGHEALWIPRLYSSLFWVAGGLAVYALARRMYPPTGNTDNGLRITDYLPHLAALAYYLLLPFAVQASRAFQPDPGMVMWSVFALYALYRWAETHVWKFAVLAGLLTGIAILVKVTAAHLLLPVFAALFLFEFAPPLIQSFRRPTETDSSLRVANYNSRIQPFLMAFAMTALMILPTALVYLLGLQQVQASEYFENTTLSLLYLFTSPRYYVSWFNFVQGLVGFSVLLLAGLGLLLSRARSRALLLGAWLGYALYALTFPYQMYTHSYYHLRLVPILALSLVPVLQAALAHLTPTRRAGAWFTYIGLAAIAAIGLLYPLWVSYDTFSKVDYRDLPEKYAAIGAQLPPSGQIIALTDDYGFSLMYYGWRKVPLWPILSERRLKELRGQPDEFDALFDRYTRGRRYFLVTNFEEFERQPVLRQTLLDNYPLAAEGDGYLLFDLKPE